MAETIYICILLIHALVQEVAIYYECQIANKETEACKT